MLDPDRIADVLAEIDFATWNRERDAGGDFAAAEAELTARFPHHGEVICAYRREFGRTLTGLVPGTAAVLAELKLAGVPCYGLSNWAAELFPEARRRFSVLNRLDGIVISGEERLAKPDPEIFRRLFHRFALDPRSCVFVDDSAANTAAAANLGMTPVTFTDADALRTVLIELGLLRPRVLPTEPVYHLAERSTLNEARRTGSYPWSTRGVTYEWQGFVHCSFRRQLRGVFAGCYRDLRPDSVIVLELDPATTGAPVVMEALGTDDAFPHLYGPLDLEAVVAERPYRSGSTISP